MSFLHSVWCVMFDIYMQNLQSTPISRVYIIRFYIHKDVMGYAGKINILECVEMCVCGDDPFCRLARQKK